uniref:Uncharacterized protein n=1 Tax=Syphacia muris TaxID=451379 RepID=A0A0N5B1M6_9BILA
MSGTIRKTVSPTVRRLKGYLNTLPEIPNTKEVAKQTAVYKDYLDLARHLYEQIHGAVGKLKRQNELWSNLLITMNKNDQEKEKRLYDAMAEDPDGMLQLVDRASEILINSKTEMKK